MLGMDRRSASPGGRTSIPAGLVPITGPVSQYESEGQKKDNEKDDASETLAYMQCMQPHIGETHLLCRCVCSLEMQTAPSLAQSRSMRARASRRSSPGFWAMDIFRALHAAMH